MFRDRELRKSVLASVVASLLVIIFVQPLLRVAWNTLLWISNHVWYGLVDTIYTSAALGQRNWVAFLILGIVCTAFIGFSINTLSAAVRLGKRKKSKSEEEIKR